MVQIPKLGTQAKISPDVPRGIGPDVSQAGAAGRSMQRLGGAIEQLGQFGAQLAAKRQKAEDDHYMNTELNNLQMSAIKNRQALDDKYGGTDYKGYTNEDSSFIDERVNDILERSPNNNVKEKLRLQLDNFKTKSFIDADSSEHRNRANFYKAEQLRQFDAQRDFLYDNPSFETAYDNVKNNIVSIESGENIFHTTEERKLYTEKQSELTKSTLEGMLSIKGGALLQAKQFIEGKSPEYKELFDGLTPKEKTSYRNRVDRAMKLQEREVLVDTVKAGNSLASLAEKESLENGNNISSRTQRQIENTINALSKFKGEEAAEAASNNLRNTLTIIEMKKNSKDMSVSELMMSKADFKTETLAEAAGDLTATKLFNEAKEKQLKLIFKDPGGAQLQSNPNIKEGTSKFFNEQVSKEYPNPAYLSKGTTAKEVALLTKAPNRLVAFENFKERWVQKDGEGKIIEDNTQEMLTQMQNKNEEIAPFVLAASLQNVTLKEAALVSDIKDTWQRHADRAGTTSEAYKKTIRTQVATKLGSFEKGFTGSPAVYTSLVDTVSLVAANYISQGNSYDKAVEYASNKVFSEYNMAKSKDGETQIALPSSKYDEKQSAFIGTFMDALQSDLHKDYLINKLGITAQDNFSDVSNEEFINAIQQNPIFSLDDKGTSLIMKYPVKGLYQPVLTKGKKVLKIPLSEINNTDFKYGDIVSTQDAINNKLGKKTALRGKQLYEQSLTMPLGL